MLPARSSLAPPAPGWRVCRDDKVHVTRSWSWMSSTDDTCACYLSRAAPRSTHPVYVFIFVRHVWDKKQASRCYDYHQYWFSSNKFRSVRYRRKSNDFFQVNIENSSLFFLLRFNPWFEIFSDTKYATIFNDGIIYILLYSVDQFL